MSLNFLQKLVLNTRLFIHPVIPVIFLILSCYQHWSRGKTRDISRQSDSCRCDQDAPLSATCSFELILPEEHLFFLSPSLLSMRAVPTTRMGCPVDDGQTGFQLDCCCRRGCHHCLVALGTAVGLSCWSLDRCGKSSSVTVLGPERLLMLKR